MAEGGRLGCPDVVRQLLDEVVIPQLVREWMELQKSIASSRDAMRNSALTIRNERRPHERD